MKKSFCTRRALINSAITGALLCVISITPAKAQLSTSCNLQGAQVAVQNKDNYTALKDLEGCFQLPQNSLTDTVGTFDPSTGNFTYSAQVTQQQVSIPLKEVEVPAISGKGLTGGSTPKIVSVPHLVGLLYANAVNVSLSFQSANGSPIQVAVKQLPFTSWSTADVTCGAGTANCPWPGAASPADWNSSGAPATVNVGKASTVMFTVGSGSSSFTGYMLIVRPPVIGAGVFTVPAIPLTIIYAPPLGVLKKNTNAYSIASTSGTSLTMSLSQDNSTTAPMNFVDAGPTFANNLQNAVSKVPGLSSLPFGAALTGEIGVINQITGSISGTTTQGVTITQGTTLNASISNVNGFTTADNMGGPGVEDIFVVLKNAQFMWTASNGRLQVSLINATLFTPKAYELLQSKDNPSGLQGLDPATIKNLLALDPFTAPYVNVPYSSVMATSNGLIPPAELTWKYAPGTAPMNSAGLVPPAPAIPARWAKLIEDDIGSNQSIATTYTLSQASANTTANYSASVTDMTAGALSFLGSGSDITQTQNNNGKTTVTTTLTTTDTQTSQANANFYVAPNEFLDVQPYYDVTVGTFAFVPLATPSQSNFSGVAVNGVGQILANQPVILQIGSQTFMTKTDAQGRYAFRSYGIAPGSAGVLTVAGITRSVQIPGAIAHLTTGISPIITKTPK